MPHENAEQRGGDDRDAGTVPRATELTTRRRRGPVVTLPLGRVTLPLFPPSRPPARTPAAHMYTTLDDSDDTDDRNDHCDRCGACRRVAPHRLRLTFADRTDSTINRETRHLCRGCWFVLEGECCQRQAVDGGIR